ncbi:hypothetical protein JCM16303_001956 [Sporobolomyces ruberrimus]
MYLPPPNSTTYRHPASQSTAHEASDYTSQRAPPTTFGSSDAKRQGDPEEADTPGASEERDGSEPGPAKKPRLPRIAEACIRCKTRKQRCVKDPGEEICKNCEGVKAECIVAPRARRKNTRSKSQSDPPGRLSPPRYAAPSPSSLQNLLRTDAPPSDLATAFDTFAVESEPPKPTPTPVPLHSFPPYPHPAPALPPRPPPFQPPPPAQYYGSRFSPAQTPHSLHWSHGPPSTSYNRVAPTSDVRTAAPAPEEDTKIHTSFEPSHQDRRDSQGRGRIDDVYREERRNSPEMHSGKSSENEDSEENEAARGVAFLSLNAGGNPIYVGPSSGFSWARLILGGMAGATRAEGGKYRPTRSRLDTRAPFDAGPRSLLAPLLTDDALAGVSNELADRVYAVAYQHIQSQFCFMDWLWLRSIFPHRVKICQAAKAQDASKATRTAAFFIWMIFALGARLAQPLPGLASPESYYTKAMEHLETIVGLHDLKNVQALLLMVVYSFRAPTAPSTWFLIGIIMRLCCSLGLHRRIPDAQAQKLSQYILQLRRRIFWSAYLMDRMLATSLGRPTSLADEEIDIELPLDCDVESLSLEQKPDKSYTSMTSSIHLIQLARRFDSARKRIYRLDGQGSKDPNDLLRALEEWESQIPAVSEEATCSSVPCCTRDWFLSKSFDARLCLLRPITVDSKTADPEHLKLLAQFAAEACEIQKRLHQDPIGTLSLETLRTVFLNGLTLLHSARLSPQALSPSVLQRALRACSNTLYAYSQQFQGAAAYYDCFEELASLVVDPAHTPSSSSSEVPLFRNLWEEIPSVMTHDTEDSFAALLNSLGVPFDNTLNKYYDATTTGNDVMYCETGFNVDPFALGGALW